ncbi:MAG: hypothetical protein ACTHN0_16515 [Aquihabitans sp.]
MLLFGSFLLVLGLVCRGLMQVVIWRHGPSGGWPGPNPEERTRQYVVVAWGTAGLGAAVLVLDLAYLALT